MDKDQSIELSIVVPCYNESKNIPLIVKRFLKIKPQGLNVELIMVDNGSNDNSEKMIADFSKKYKEIKLAKVKKNIGYGFGIYIGLKAAKGNILCWTHADMQTDLNDTITGYNILTKRIGRCFVKGNRKKRPLFDLFFTYGMSIFETIILMTPLYDINAQPNIFRREFLDEIGKPPKDFSFDLFFYYKAKKMGYEIIRFPVDFKKRMYGVSHWNTGLKSKWSFIKRTIDFTFKMKRKH